MPDEVEDEADNMQSFMNNERRGEIASLEGHISDYKDSMANETQRQKPKTKWKTKPRITRHW